MQQFQIGEKVRYIKYKNKIAEIVFYIPGSNYTKELYAIKYLRGDMMVNDEVSPELLTRIDIVVDQISIFDNLKLI